jgi:tRNA1Val (adenine37-N6)-methyltransferase
MKVTTDGCLFGAWAASRIKSQKSKIKNLLDIGTGTGLLSLMIAQKNDMQIDAIELDKEAIKQASENINTSPWPGRINVFNGDIREFEFTKKYDSIISNPPFYENELKGDNSKKNIAYHNDGLLFIELINIIKKNLTPEGSFYLLLPFKRNEEIRNLLTENDLAITQLVFARPSINHNFFRIMAEGKIKTDSAAEIKIDEISIKDENDQYTMDFTDLLKEFYLHL